MQGHLYVENEDAPKLKFQTRFFALFPFCGLRWFTEEPEGEVHMHRIQCLSYLISV